MAIRGEIKRRFTTSDFYLSDSTSINRRDWFLLGNTEGELIEYELEPLVQSSHKRKIIKLAFSRCNDYIHDANAWKRKSNVLKYNKAKLKLQFQRAQAFSFLKKYYDYKKYTNFIAYVNRKSIRIRDHSDLRSQLRDYINELHQS